MRVAMISTGFVGLDYRVGGNIHDPADMKKPGFTYVSVGRR